MLKLRKVIKVHVPPWWYVYTGGRSGLRPTLELSRSAHPGCQRVLDKPKVALPLLFMSLLAGGIVTGSGPLHIMHLGNDGMERNTITEE